MVVTFIIKYLQTIAHILTCNKQITQISTKQTK